MTTSMIRARPLSVLLALAACSPVGDPSHPAPPDWHTDAERCAWQWRKGGGLGLWTETCDLSTGRWEVAWDDRRSAFVLLRDAQVAGIVVQSWPVPPGAGLEALTAALTAAGHLEPASDCQWKRVPLRPAPRTFDSFALQPSAPGALQPTAQGEVPEPLCGPYGASTHGVRYFITDLRWPHRAIFVDEGQERPMFDPASITVLR